MYIHQFPAKLESLYDMLDFIQTSEILQQASKDFLDKIIVAVEEVLVNIISYAYPSQQEGTIEITCEKSFPKNGLKMTIKDQGIPFNPIKYSTPPPIHLLSHNSSLGGYGIYLFLGIMDHVEYDRVNHTNILSFIKYF
jgi:serine/threonine-protein kinase RsbW